MLNVDQLLCKIIWGQLQSIGFFTEEHTKVDLESESRLHAWYRRWFKETAVLLTRNHYLIQDGDVYTALDTTPLDMPAFWLEWNAKKTTLLEDSSMKAMVALVDTTVKALPEILSGKVAATDIIFPDASMHLVEGIYKQNQIADYFNEVLADTLIAYIQERLKQDQSLSLRIFEVGAGTGGTSAMIFSKLQPYRAYVQEYCYTDLSRAFLLHAEREYGSEYPYLTYALFNAEAPLASQNIEAGGYDVVIAANVLHATKNIRQTLRNVKAVLKSNGLLLLNEISSNNLFSHLTFGLLEGWWLYEDPELRIPGCPALYSEAWQNVLEDQGFYDITFMAPDEHDLGQQIIVAGSDGVIRQMQWREPETVIKPARTKGIAKEQLSNQIPYAMQTEKSKKQRGQERIEVSAPLPGNLLAAQTLQFVKETLALAIKLSPEKIEAETSFERYGIDSILQVNFIRELEKITGELPKTILFEYSNAQELADYLLKNHPDNLQQWASSQVHTLREHQKAAYTNAYDRTSSVSVKTDRFRKPQEVGWQDPEESQSIQEQTVSEQEGRAKEYETDDIAIIGISGRYPLSDTLEELWEHLKAGHNCITEATLDRWPHSPIKHLAKNAPPTIDRKYYGGFLERTDQFDYQLFEVNRQQVMEMTPEIRQFLEVVWETFEDAGYGKSRLSKVQERYKKGVGVFVGNMYNQYFWSIPSLEQAVLSSNGTDWHIANRVSHFFNLTGPSLAISSACSSSLNAVHLACESLKLRSCSMAIAGGINLTLDPSKYTLLQDAHLLGSGNESKSFGAGDGFIPGEGIGAVLLKPLSKAKQDHDYIYAVIKSSSANHSGGRQMYTAPDPKQQAQLIINSIEQAGVDPITIGYIESAANGSELGDAIEVIALQQAFTHYTEKKQVCALGSVKSNLGHLEAASGMSQLSKVLLQMKHATLVPTINAKPGNPHIKLEKTAFYLQEEVVPWIQLLDPENGKRLPRRSMINSFGAGGAYANLIVEEYIEEDTSNLRGPVQQKEYLLIFSAKTEWSLLNYLEKMQVWLRKNSSIDIADLACSLQKANHGLKQRVAILASSIYDLSERLDQLQRSRMSQEKIAVYTSFDRDPGIDATDTYRLLQFLEKKDLRQVAQYWVAGAGIDFQSLYNDKQSSKLDLPHYVFDHRIQFNFTNAASEDERWVEQDLMGSQSGEALSTVRAKISSIEETYVYNEPYLRGHQIAGEQILVGATHASLVIKAFFSLFPAQRSVRICKLNYVEPIEVKANQKVEVRVNVSPKDTTDDFQVVYRYATSGDWRVTATGKCEKALFESKNVDIESIKGSLHEFHALGRIYQRDTALVEWGDLFKTITSLSIGRDQLLARIVLDAKAQEHTHTYELNPLITNTAYLAILYLLGEANIEGAFLPFGINEIKFARHKAFTEGWLHIKLIKNSNEVMIFDVDAINEKSEIVVQYYGYALKHTYNSPGTVDERGSIFTGLIEQQTESTKASTPIYLNGATHTDVLSGKISQYLTNKIREVVPAFSGFTDSEVNLLDLGLNSSGLVAMTRKIESEANVELNATLFFEYPNSRELTKFFATEHKEAFEHLLVSITEPMHFAASVYKPDMAILSDRGSTVKSAEPANGEIATLFLQLFQRLQSYLHPAIDLVGLQQCRTLQEMIDILSVQREDEAMLSDQQIKEILVDIQHNFPELIHLNEIHRGKPIFWFHGGQGGVEIYRAIARKSQRPFYGIQARGYMSNRLPLNGIEEMAAYYVRIIKAVQPAGPYDLGGYSLGGVLAYEITRQLQQAGQEVKTIVMIDAPYSTKFKEKEPSFKTLILQTLNTMLASAANDTEKLVDLLISREEIDLEIGDEEFLKQMLNLARKRGLNRRKTQIQNQLQKNIEAQRAYKLEDYLALPLPDARAVNCYYLRNRSGVFLGDLEPYLTTPADKIALDHTAYWEEWERQIPEFHIVDIDSSNHMMMLSEPRACDAIVAFCEKLYAIPDLIWQSA